MVAIARKLLLLLAAASLIFIAPASASLRVNPFIVYIAPNAQGSSQVVQLTNVTDINLAFEVNVMKRTIVDAHEVDVAADDDFVIFPSQMIIRSHETQSLRIQWVVGQVHSTSDSYYVYVTQVPVEVQPGVTGIRVAYRFGIAVHITPPGTHPELRVLAVRPATNAAGVHGFQLDVQNDGTRYGRMSEHELQLNGRDSWNPQRLKNAVGIGFLLPGQRSTYFVPFDGAVTASSTATLANHGPS